MNEELCIYSTLRYVSITMLRSYQFKNKTKSVTRTIRIDEDIDFQLEKLAHEQRVSVNYFANQALRKFVEWDVFADRLGFVTLPSDIFEKLMGYTTDEQAKELGNWFGKNLAKDLIAFLFKRVDLETSVRALELLGPRYGKAFRFEYTNDGHLTTVILNHGARTNISSGHTAIVQFRSTRLRAFLCEALFLYKKVGASTCIRRR